LLSVCGRSRDFTACLECHAFHSSLKRESGSGRRAKEKRSRAEESDDRKEKQREES
jgi:hypothetical protein